MSDFHLWHRAWAFRIHRGWILSLTLVAGVFLVLGAIQIENYPREESHERIQEVSFRGDSVGTLFSRYWKYLFAYYLGFGIPLVLLSLVPILGLWLWKDETLEWKVPHWNPINPSSYQVHFPPWQCQHRNWKHLVGFLILCFLLAIWFLFAGLGGGLGYFEGLHQDRFTNQTWHTSNGELSFPVTEDHSDVIRVHCTSQETPGYVRERGNLFWEDCQNYYQSQFDRIYHLCCLQVTETTQEWENQESDRWKNMMYGSLPMMVLFLGSLMFMLYEEWSRRRTYTRFEKAWRGGYDEHVNGLQGKKLETV